jgi:hypothetical protein
LSKVRPGGRSLKPRWCTTGAEKAETRFQLLYRFFVFPQNAAFSEWTMLSSNQRPLPCEGGSTTISWLFDDVQNHLETSTFTLMTHRVCSSLFAWVAAPLLHKTTPMRCASRSRPTESPVTRKSPCGCSSGLYLESYCRGHLLFLPQHRQRKRLVL